jgi:hypothetical protein
VDDIATSPHPEKSPHAPLGVDDDPDLCPVPSPVLQVGHFSQALVGHSCQAPKLFLRVHRRSQIKAGPSNGEIRPILKERFLRPQNLACRINEILKGRPVLQLKLLRPCGLLDCARDLFDPGVWLADQAELRCNGRIADSPRLNFQAEEIETLTGDFIQQSNAARCSSVNAGETQTTVTASSPAADVSSWPRCV